MVKGNSIKGLDSNRFYVVEFSGQHGESCWRLSASRYTEPTAGLTTSGSHQITCRQNSEKLFAFEGEIIGFTNVKICIHGEWIADLPKLATGTASDYGGGGGALNRIASNLS
ncbi:MAG: hypothetical protein WB586_26355 [Chthoniobacterales bacterium]